VRRDTSVVRGQLIQRCKMKRLAFRLLLLIVLIGLGVADERTRAAPFPQNCCDEELVNLCTGACFAAYGTGCADWVCVKDDPGCGCPGPCTGSFSFSCT